MLDKKALRREIGAKKRAMSAEEIERASARLAEKFFQTELYRQAKAIYGYLSYNQEVRTEPILRRAQADGKRVAVPKVYGDEMRFLWLDDLQQVAPGAYGIPEPIADGPVAMDETALVLMPGLAFDPEGHRLGYGGGFYDRWLSAHSCPSVCLCRQPLLCDALPIEGHDHPVNLVLTELGQWPEGRKGTAISPSP